MNKILRAQRKERTMNFMHPHATLVNAYVGPFADDFLGDFPGPGAAVKAAKDAGYRFVSIMYMNGNSETVEV